jgi:hypothetical protein
VRGIGLAVLVLTLAACGSGDPTRLSETGLYADFATRTLAEGVIPLRPRYPLWSDGAEKRRWLRLPVGARIDTSDMDAWRFPVGTRLWKEFSIGGRLIETRLLEKRRDPDDGGWFQMAYAWRDDERDAIAAPDGVKDARGSGYDVPAQRDCGQCHYKGEKPVIGVAALQLSASPDADPPAIDALVAAGVLTAPPSRSYAPPGAGVVQDALGYLHGNCSYCHDRRSAVAADVKVFMNLSVDDARPEDTNTYQTLVGQPIHHFPDVGLGGEVVPGRPDLSLVHYRMARRDASQMPPLITKVIDEAGLATIDAWIQGL